MLRPLLADMVRAVVDDPEAVRIEVIPQTDATEYRLYVAPADVSKVIGKQDCTARSLRPILSAAGMRLHHRYALDIAGAAMIEKSAYNAESK